MFNVNTHSSSISATNLEYLIIISNTKFLRGYVDDFCSISVRITDHEATVNVHFRSSKMLRWKSWSFEQYNHNDRSLSSIIIMTLSAKCLPFSWQEKLRLFVVLVTSQRSGALSGCGAREPGSNLFVDLFLRGSWILSFSSNSSIEDLILVSVFL